MSKPFVPRPEAVGARRPLAPAQPRGLSQPRSLRAAALAHVREAALAGRKPDLVAAVTLARSRT